MVQVRLAGMHTWIETMKADMCNRVLDNAVQIHGGMGYIWESEINRLFRATKLLEIGAGTTEVRKLIIAGELLR
jgi:isovaleryl-CoA dehydrogenase